MATDGVKIIDGDLAHDTYTMFLDKFDRGIDIETIKAETLSEKEYCDDFDYEILITSYALAMWETGNLDEKTFEEVKAIIQKGACVKRWEEWEKSLGKQREKVLEKFLAKISIPKKNPRRVKNFKEIKNILFDENDVVAFKIGDDYYASIITQVEKIRNYCIYTFSILDFKSLKMPKLNQVVSSNILVSKIGCWESEETILQRQPGLSQIFGSLEHELSSKFFLGLVAITTEHKKLKKFSANFIKIGKIEIIEGYKYRIGNAYSTTFEEFSFSYKNFIENFEIFRNYKIPVAKTVKYNYD